MNNMKTRSIFFLTTAFLLLLSLNYAQSQTVPVPRPPPNTMQQYYKVMDELKNSSIGSVLKSTETYLQVITVCLTNMCALPAIFICFNNGMYGECIIGFMTILTSTLYHICETCQIMIWGMNDGKWHRLDNVFIIISLQNLFIFMFLNHDMKFMNLNGASASVIKQAKQFLSRERRWIHLLQWIGVAHCLTCQEKAPWKEFYTYTPILTILVLCIIKSVYNRIMFNRGQPGYHWNRMLLGFMCLGVAVYFFIIGLDDDNDVVHVRISKSILVSEAAKQQNVSTLSSVTSSLSILIKGLLTSLPSSSSSATASDVVPLRVWRIYHGMWHVFVSLSFFCFYFSKRVFSNASQKSKSD